MLQLVKETMNEINMLKEQNKDERDNSKEKVNLTSRDSKISIENRKFHSKQKDKQAIVLLPTRTIANSATAKIYLCS